MNIRSSSLFNPRRFNAAFFTLTFFKLMFFEFTFLKLTFLKLTSLKLASFKLAAYRAALGLGITAFSSALVLSGCGFQLRGLSQETRLRIQHIDLAIADDTPQNALARDLRQRLISAGVQENSHAHYRLNVAAVSIAETNVGYSGSSDQERQVTLSVPYTLQRVNDGAYLTGQERIVTYGTYQTSDHQLLQRDDQRARVEGVITDEAASQLVERLRTLSDASVMAH